MIVLVLMVAMAAGERTVLVTPRPRWYQPSRFVQEPLRDPSSPLVPSLLPLRRPAINIRVLHPSPNALSSASLPVEHRVEKPVSLSERPIVVVPESLTENVLVESLPSLSVKLEDGPSPPLPDYLTPPKFPSVYDKLLPIANAITPQSPKKKKRNKKRKPKVDAKERHENIPGNSNDNLHNLKPQTSGERVEFQLHGQNGPDSYKFGFDTGAGKNRQFRFEEKDANGNVKGHFGYYDTTGKLQMFNYRADETGFHAEQV